MSRHWKFFCVPALALFTAVAGCGGSSGSTTPVITPPPIPTPPAGPTAATSIYVGEELPTADYAILQFSATANGVSTPLSTLTMPTGLQINAIATDAVGNLYVAGQFFANPISEIFVYAPGSTGSAAPIRTITGSLTGLDYSICLTVDATGQLYVCGANKTISVFPAGAKGNIAPTRVISGTATLLNNPYRIAVDGTGNLYVGNGEATAGRILIFPPGATGNVAPTLITGVATNLGSVFGLACDSAGNLYVASRQDGSFGGIYGILEFASDATGNAAPINTISGKLTAFIELQGISVDAVGKIYVAGIDSALSVNGAVFPPTATGNVAPGTIFHSISWDDASLINLAIH